MSSTKGARLERELTNELDSLGFAVIRVPSSGSATQRDLPDVIAGNGTDTYAIEVKASKAQPIYLDGGEVDSLEHFAERFGAKPLIGARFNREPWRFYEPNECHVTDGGMYRVKKELANSAGRNLEGLA